MKNHDEPFVVMNNIMCNTLPFNIGAQISNDGDKTWHENVVLGITKPHNYCAFLIIYIYQCK